MRTVLLVVVVSMLAIANRSRAELPITQIGSADIHRIGDPVSKITLAQPYERQAVVLRGKLQGKRDPQCAIETGSFLKEPLPEPSLFSDQLLDSEGVEPEYEEHRQAVHQNLDAPISKRGKLLPHPVDLKSLETSADEKISELLRASAADAEYAIATGVFLQEPLPEEKLFHNDYVFAPQLNRPSRSEGIKFGGVVIGR